MADDPELGRVLARAVAELRRPVAIDESLDRRVLEALRRRPGWAARCWAWLRTPRTLRVSPLSLAAGGVVVLALFLAVAGRRGGSAPGQLVALPSGGEPVQFVLTAPRASSVHLVGDFNDWDAAATPLRHERGAVWSVTIPLLPGRYRYTFVVDGRRWVADPGKPPALGDDFGRPTSVITVLTGQT